MWLGLSLSLSLSLDMYILEGAGHSRTSAPAAAAHKARIIRSAESKATRSDLTGEEAARSNKWIGGRPSASRAWSKADN